MKPTFGRWCRCGPGCCCPAIFGVPPPGWLDWMTPAELRTLISPFLVSMLRSAPHPHSSLLSLFSPALAEEGQEGGLCGADAAGAGPVSTEQRSQSTAAASRFMRLRFMRSRNLFALLLQPAAADALLCLC